MRKCYPTALLLISWYLMLPPPVFPPVQDAKGEYQMNATAPITQWLKLKTLKSEKECKTQLKKMPAFYRCFASNDPVLKSTPKTAAGAPSTSTMSGAAANHMQ
jgi:hypothetical protein